MRFNHEFLNYTTYNKRFSSRKISAILPGWEELS